MIARFAPALAAVSPALRAVLAPRLDHHAFAGWLSAPQVKELMQAGGLDEDVLFCTLLPPMPSHRLPILMSALSRAA